MDKNTAVRIHRGISLEDAFLKDREAVIESVKKEENKDKKIKERNEMFKFLISYFIKKYASVFKNYLDEKDIIR